MEKQHAPAADRVVVRLELGTGAGRIRVERSGAAADYPLPVGTAAVSALWRREPPNEGELEAAIDLVEEAVMPLAKAIPGRAVLVAGDEMARMLVGVSTGCDASQAASLDAVEARFGQLALAAQRGAWTREDRMDPSTSAGLLILRELMHHAGFERIELRAADDALAGFR